MADCVVGSVYTKSAILFTGQILPGGPIPVKKLDIFLSLARVTVELSTDKATEASAAIEERVSDIELPTGVSYDVGGVTEQIQESFTQLGLAMLAAIAIVAITSATAPAWLISVAPRCSRTRA